MKKRIAYWDNIKFFMIMAVVVGHFVNEYAEFSELYQSMYLFFYAFHMPVFIFISGLFYNRKKTREYVLFYLAGGMILKMIFAVTKMITWDVNAFNLMADSNVPWFLFALANFYLITYFLGDMDLRPVITLFVLLACFVGYDETVGDLLYISRTIVFFPFFLLGKSLSADRERILEVRSKGKIFPFLIAVAFLVLWGYICINYLEQAYVLRHLFTGRNAYKDTVIEMGWAYRLLCYGISFVLGWCVLMVCPAGRLPVITKGGGRSINAFFWHMPALFVMMEFCRPEEQLFEDPRAEAGIILAAVIICLILVSVRIFEWPLIPIKKVIMASSLDDKKE